MVNEYHPDFTAYWNGGRCGQKCCWNMQENFQGKTLLPSTSSQFRITGLVCMDIIKLALWRKSISYSTSRPDIQLYMAKWNVFCWCNSKGFDLFTESITSQADFFHWIIWSSKTDRFQDPSVQTNTNMKHLNRPNISAKITHSKCNNPPQKK